MWIIVYLIIKSMANIKKQELGRDGFNISSDNVCEYPIYFI